jgi:hypothetical protein
MFEKVLPIAYVSNPELLMLCRRDYLMTLSGVFGMAVGYKRIASL